MQGNKTWENKHKTQKLPKTNKRSNLCENIVFGKFTPKRAGFQLNKEYSGKNMNTNYFGQINHMVTVQKCRGHGIGMEKTINTPWKSHLEHRQPTVRGVKGTIKNYGCSLTKPLVAPLSETETCTFSQTNSSTSAVSLRQGHPSKNTVSSTTVHGQVKQYLQKKLEENTTSKASNGIEEIETEMNLLNVNMKMHDLSDDGCVNRTKHARGECNMCAKMRESPAAVGQKLITCVCRHDLFNRKPQRQNITYHELVNTMDQNNSCGKLNISNNSNTKVVITQTSRGGKWAKETSTERTDMETFIS